MESMVQKELNILYYYIHNPVIHISKDLLIYLNK